MYVELGIGVVLPDGAGTRSPAHLIPCPAHRASLLFAESGPGAQSYHLTYDRLLDSIQKAFRADQKVPAASGKIQPGRSFPIFSITVCQLADKMGLVPPLGPGLSQICTNGPRGPTDLIR